MGAEQGRGLGLLGQLGGAALGNVQGGARDLNDAMHYAMLQMRQNQLGMLHQQFAATANESDRVSRRGPVTIVELETMPVREWLQAQINAWLRKN